MEQVVIVEGGGRGCKEQSCPPARVQYTMPRTTDTVVTRTYQSKPVPRDDFPDDCCLPTEIIVPLKKSCLYLSQTPVLLFIILISLVYVISCVQCWCACSCCTDNGQCKSKCDDGGSCDTDSTARWTAFAINTLVYLLLAIIVSMWIYRLAQYKQTTLLSITMSVAVPVFCWWFFWYINQLMLYATNNNCNGNNCN